MRLKLNHKTASSPLTGLCLDYYRNTRNPTFERLLPYKPSNELVELKLEIYDADPSLLHKAQVPDPNRKVGTLIVRKNLADVATGTSLFHKLFALDCACLEISKRTPSVTQAISLSLTLLMIVISTWTIYSLNCDRPCGYKLQTTGPVTGFRSPHETLVFLRLPTVSKTILLFHS